LEFVNSYLDSTFDIRDTRNDCASGIVSVLANKHKQSAQSPDAEPGFYQSILGHATERLDRGLSDPRLDQQPEIGMGLVYQAITVLEGGFPRQDKHIPRNVPVLHKAIAHGVPRVGWYAALSLERLVREHPYLSNDGHAIIRPLYKQWAYAILAKPLYVSALPVNQEYPQGLNNAIAILSVIRRCSFAVYGDDVQDIVRLIVATLQKLLGPDTGYASANDTIAALVVLQEILDKDHLALREHLPSIMENLIKAVARPTEVSGRKPPSAYCRKLSVQILSYLPSKFEEHYLLRYSLQINRLLAESCGDPVRDVRREAMAARERWAKIN
jgi:DNA repair/transcription protein MET18/MMS19